MKLLLALALVCTQPELNTSPITVGHCKIEYKQSTRLGAPTFGNIQELSVKRGDSVKAGQVIGHLTYNEEVSEVDLDSVLAQSDVAVKLANANYKIAAMKYDISRRLYARQACSLEQLWLDNYTAEAATVTISQAQEAHRVAELTHARAKARVAARQIIAPHDGVISEVFHRQGESITVGEPCVQIDDTSTLQVSGKVDVRESFGVKPGDRAKVRFDIPEAGTLSDLGVVVFVDTKINPNTSTRLVVVDVKNKTGAGIAGLEASMTIQPAEYRNATK